MVGINLVAVALAAVAGMVFGGIWYGPLFGKQWMKLSGTTKAMLKKMKISPAQGYLMGFIGALLQAYVLAYFIMLLSVTELAEALKVAFWLWLGFIAVIQFGSVTWEGKPFKLFLLHTVASLISTGIMATVIMQF